MGLEPATSGVTGRIGAQRCSATSVAEQGHLQVLSAQRPPPLRMVKRLRRWTFGPRAGHGMLSVVTTLQIESLIVFLPAADQREHADDAGGQLRPDEESLQERCGPVGSRSRSASR